MAKEVRPGIASNGFGGPEERGVDGGETPRKQQKKRGISKRCVATAHAVGGGDDVEHGGLDDAARDVGASSYSTVPPLSLTATMQAIEHELQRCTLEKGLDNDNDDDNESTAENDLSWWWCRLQFEYPTLARLAKKRLSDYCFVGYG